MKGQFVFGETTEKRIMREASKIVTLKEDIDAVSWNRVLEIGKQLQGDVDPETRETLGSELVGIAHSNLSLYSHFGIEPMESAHVMSSGIEVLEGGLAEAAIEEQASEPAPVAIEPPADLSVPVHREHLFSKTRSLESLRSDASWDELLGSTADEEKAASAPVEVQPSPAAAEEPSEPDVAEEPSDPAPFQKSSDSAIEELIALLGVAEPVRVPEAAPEPALATEEPAITPAAEIVASVPEAVVVASAPEATEPAPLYDAADTAPLPRIAQAVPRVEGVDVPTALEPAPRAETMESVLASLPSVVPVSGCMTEDAAAVQEGEPASTTSHEVPEAASVPASDPSPAPALSLEPARASKRRARFARFRTLYESRDHGLCVFEDEHGHLVAVDASKLA